MCFISRKEEEEEKERADQEHPTHPTAPQFAPPPALRRVCRWPPLPAGLAGAVEGLMALVDGVDQFLLVRAVSACVMAGSMTLAFSAMSKRVADEYRTLAFALVQSCMQFGLALGPLLGALVVRTANGPDFRFAFVVAAILCGASGTGMLLLRRIERRRAN